MTINRLLYSLLFLLLFNSCSKSDSSGGGGGTTNNPVPILNSISPTTAIAGSGSFTLTATGINFVSASVINFAGFDVPTTFISSTQLTAVIPAGYFASAGGKAVFVRNPAPGGGSSGSLTFQVTATFPVPTLTSINPNTATPGGGAFTLTVYGTNFLSNSTINWNGTALTTTYLSATQLSTLVPAANIAVAGTANVTVFSPGPGGGTSNALPFSIATPPVVKKFLFDATHAETAGNADWVIDEDASTPQRIPTPNQSTITASTPETFWTGALSSWGIALAKLGHTVETLPTGIAITFGNAGNPQDLSNYDVFVVDEPNKVFTAAEKTAILNFVNSGGGLLMISDHTASDRDGDGWDSPAIWNDLMTNNTVQTNPFGFSIDLLNISEVTSNIWTNAASSTILTGSQGAVTQVQFSNGTTATTNVGVNPNVKGLIWKTGATQNSNNVMSLSSTFGTGRVFFIGDSSPMDDGTGDAGNTLFMNWPNYSHKNLFMNASLWLAKIQ